MQQANAQTAERAFHLTQLQVYANQSAHQVKTTINLAMLVKISVQFSRFIIKKLGSVINAQRVMPIIRKMIHARKSVQEIKLLILKNNIVFAQKDMRSWIEPAYPSFVQKLSHSLMKH